MITGPFVARHRRLLVWCAVSAALHLLALGWLGRRPAAPGRLDPPRHAIATRLGAPQAAPAPPARAPSAPPPRARRSALPALPRTAASSQAATSGAEPAGGSWPAVAGADSEAPQFAPATYRVNPPPPVALSYSVTRSVPGQAPAAAGGAQLRWQIYGTRYTLQMNGVAGALASEGGFSDAGIAPDSARATLGDGGEALASFARELGELTFSGSANSYADVMGSQDRAALLLQMAGMGRADPLQMQGVLSFFVAGEARAGVVRFEVLGEEDLATPLGAMRTVRLAQMGAPGEARLEVWLAPAREWYPVQLRLTAPDGAVSNQLVSAIGPPPR